MTRRSTTRTRNLGYAAVAGLAGCATIGFVIVGLLLGLWLDAQAGVRGPFTIGLLLVSIPVSLGVMVWIAVSMVKRIQPPPKRETREELLYTEEE